MQASVYRLRQRGVKMPRPQQFVSGRLLMTQGLDSANRATLRAQLVSDQGALLLPTLNGAQVRRITENGIVIIGTEVIPRRNGAKASADFWPQTWWCMVLTPAIAAELTGTYEEMVMTPGSATGF
jgi:hypothetical protein